MNHLTAFTGTIQSHTAIQEMCLCIRNAEPYLPLEFQSVLQLGIYSPKVPMVFSNHFLQVNVVECGKRVDLDDCMDHVKDCKNIHFYEVDRVDWCNEIKKYRKFNARAIDVVYSYADTYEQMIFDLRCALTFPNIKFLAGHGYSADNWKTVKKAVDEICKQPDKIFEDTSWLFQIK